MLAKEGKGNERSDLWTWMDFRAIKIVAELLLKTLQSVE